MKSLSRSLFLLLFIGLPLIAQPIPDRNVNMVAGTGWPDGDPFLQRQNEPSIAVSTRNPLHLLAGANDYRTVDLPGLLDIKVMGDAWAGVFRSYDGGQTWRSGLMPGYPQDLSAEGVASPLKGYPAAADPVVRAGSNGLFFYSGIVLTRTTPPLSAGYVTRYLDFNDKEAGESIRFVDTKIFDRGIEGQFVDKPWLAVDIPRTKAKTCTIGGTSFPGGNVYIAYAVMLGDGTNEHTKLLFVRSTDCGQTWSSPLKFSESEGVSQGTAFGIDPVTGSIFIAWRRFATANSPDAILCVRSTDGGATFTKPLEIAKFTPFEQNTTATSMRTSAFPSVAIDGSGAVDQKGKIIRNGRIYVAWSQRGLGPGPNGIDARVVLVTSTDGTKWSAPAMVDPSPARGHQLMPSLTFSEGKLTLLHYDLREDNTVGIYQPDPARPGFFIEHREPRGDLPGRPERVFGQYLDDLGMSRRHTVDVRVAQSDPGEVPIFTTARVSSYLFGSRQGSTIIEQLQVNPPNLPMFKLGTVPFFGDYIDIIGQQIKHNGTSWVYNLEPSSAPVFHAVWTDNRDVRPPPSDPNCAAPAADGRCWQNYTPVNSAANTGTSVFDGSPLPPCSPGQGGSRNQNIYTARVTRGLFAASPGNSKQVRAFQRAYVVFVQNTLTVPRSYRLSIAQQPAGGKASFLEVPYPGYPDPLTTVDVTIAPRSSISRTVFVSSTDPANPLPRVGVDVKEITAPTGPEVPAGLQTNVVLNPDIANPDIANPDIANPDIANPDIANAEVYNPDIANPDIANPDIANPDIANPDIANPDIANPDIANPDIANPDIANPDIANPDIANPDIANPDIANPDIANASLVDTTWKMTNNGNTAAAYSVKLLLNEQVPGGIMLQLILHRVYQTPVALGCTLTTQPQTIVIANIPNPTFVEPTKVGAGKMSSTATEDGGLQFDPADPRIENATVWIAPGETIRITLRVYDPDKNDGVTFDAATAVTPVAIAQAINTEDLADGITTPPMSLTITSPGFFGSTRRFADALLGTAYSATLLAVGGTGARSWSVNPATLPPGLTLLASGAITGTPTTPGSYTFTATVTDSATPPVTESAQVLLRVVFPLRFELQPHSAASVGVLYNELVGLVSGGVLPRGVSHSPEVPGLIFTPGGDNGALYCSIRKFCGVIFVIGTPTAAGSYVYDVTISDSTWPVPQQVVTRIPLSVIDLYGSLSFVTQPSNTISGTPVSPSIIVHADSGGIPVAGLWVALRMKCNGTALAGTAIATTNGSGDASFINFIAPRGGYDCVLQATSGGSSAQSNPFDAYGFGDAPPLAQRVDAWHTATRLKDGKVLIAGGLLLDTRTVGNSAQLYDPATGSVSVLGPMVTGRFLHTATLLSDGRVVIAGGLDQSEAPTGSIEIFDPATNSFTAAGALRTPRRDHSAVLMANGDVLLSGGVDGGLILDSVEQFSASALSSTTLPWSMLAPRQGHSSLLLPDGRIAMIGGAGSGGQIDLFTPGVGFSAGGSLLVPRDYPVVVPLDDGTILIAGGQTGSMPTTVTAAEIYDPATSACAMTGSMIESTRWDAAAAKLRDGTVIIAGGVYADGSGNGWSRDSVQRFTTGYAFETYGKLASPKSLAIAVTAGDTFLIFGGGTRNVEKFVPVRTSAPLVNGDFDTDLAGWEVFNSLWSALDSCTTASCSPSGSITQQGSSDVNVIARQPFAVTAGKKFSFHAAIRSAVGRFVGTEAPLHVDFYPDRLSDGTCTGTAVVPGVGDGVNRLFGGRVLRPGVWESAAAYGTIPAGAACAVLSLDNSDLTDQLWFDAIYFGVER